MTNLYLIHVAIKIMYCIKCSSYQNSKKNVEHFKQNILIILYRHNNIKGKSSKYLTSNICLNILTKYQIRPIWLKKNNS